MQPPTAIRSAHCFASSARANASMLLTPGMQQAAQGSRHHGAHRPLGEILQGGNRRIVGDAERFAIFLNGNVLYSWDSLQSPVHVVHSQRVAQKTRHVKACEPLAVPDWLIANHCGGGVLPDVAPSGCQADPSPHGDERIHPPICRSGLACAILPHREPHGRREMRADRLAVTS